MFKRWIQSLRTSARCFARDERGGEVMEYALVVGLIVVGAIVTIRVFGQFVAYGWSYIAGKM